MQQGVNNIAEITKNIKQKISSDPKAVIYTRLTTDKLAEKPQE